MLNYQRVHPEPDLELFAGHTGGRNKQLPVNRYSKNIAGNMGRFRTPKFLRKHVRNIMLVAIPKESSGADHAKCWLNQKKNIELKKKHYV